MRFSEREGIIKKTIQENSIDEELRNRLWNVFIKYLRKLKLLEKGFVLRFIWIDEMKKTIDDFPQEPIKPKGERRETGMTEWFGPITTTNQDVVEYEDVLLPKYKFDIDHKQRKIKTYFLNCEWYKVYEFMEFLLLKFKSKFFNNLDFKSEVNKVLEEEKSTYRIVGKYFSKIIDEIERKEIETVLLHPIDSVKEHIKQAFIHYSNRDKPDYRNSIKESISGVESLCKIISKNPNATLGDALKIIEKDKDIELHPAQKVAFSKLYGWTSDKTSGIRHGMLELSNIQSEDARFMLIACSAFINYLTEKANKASIPLE